MSQAMTSDLFKDTPTITVLDNRGLHVRTVEFNRQLDQGTPSALDTLISCHRYNAIGQLSASADPRFFKQEKNNLTQISSLTGQTLRVDSIDAGWRIGMLDITAAPHKEWEERGTLRRYAYDTDFHRPTAIAEQPNAKASEQVSERFVYAEAQDAPHNLNQQLIRHYDNAGLSTTISISLSGQTLAQQRQLLSSLSDDSDWQGDTETAWQAHLASTTYTMHRTCNALGTVLSQTDAKGNQQRSEYDVAGYLSATYLQAASATTEQTIVSAIEYNANGQKVHETAGNNVETIYTYDQRNWRLMQTCSHRPLVTGRATLLQDLRYQYDPVGNIISIDDRSQARRFYKNQQVSATCQYAYDSLYQLTSATGRENDAIPAQSSAPPPLNDSTQYVNYTRSYQYDRGGNLAQVHHRGASQYTLDMQVSNQSNRAVQQRSTKPVTPAEVDAHFDAHGNLKQLAHSKDLFWGRRDQLKQVTLTANQQESYQYTLQGNRIRKTFSDTSTNSEREVVYLPGLELRLTRQHGKVSEEQHVVTIANAGRAQVRLLHWASGKPADETDIPNNQLRYTLDNHLGSSHLELDQNADILTLEEYYPFGGTAVWSAKSRTEAKYKTIRYSGKERDVTGLYYYGYRYYAAWMGRWLNSDPEWTIDGLNLYRMVRNNPVSLYDVDGRAPPPSGSTAGGTTGTKRKYDEGSHGYRKTEQNLLGTTGTSHESEHVIGIDVLINDYKWNSTTNQFDKIGSNSRKKFKAEENAAPAYQAVKAAHRDHVGTGNVGGDHDRAKQAGLSAADYRGTQRAQLKSEEPGVAYQINQLGYAHSEGAKAVYSVPSSDKNLEAVHKENISFYKMINRDYVEYATDPNDVSNSIKKLSFNSVDRLEMMISRFAVVNRRYPTTDEALEVKNTFDVKLSDDHIRATTWVEDAIEDTKIGPELGILWDREKQKYPT